MLLNHVFFQVFPGPEGHSAGFAGILLPFGLGMARILMTDQLDQSIIAGEAEVALEEVRILHRDSSLITPFESFANCTRQSAFTNFRA